MFAHLYPCCFLIANWASKAGFARDSDTVGTASYAIFLINGPRKFVFDSLQRTRDMGTYEVQIEKKIRIWYDFLDFLNFVVFSAWRLPL